MSFFDELKRRNVFRVGIAYVVVVWLLMQVADVVINNIEAPDWVFQVILLVLGIGFPVVIMFAWAFEMTPEGIKKEKDVDRSESITPQTGHKLDRTIIVVLALALGYFAWDKFAGGDTDAPESGQAQIVAENPEQAAIESTLPTDKSIAVLPFDNRSSEAEDEFFTTGIHDDLLTQLAQISSLRVISRTSVVQFKDTNKSIREIAELLGVATILEGGVQRAGNQVRINMQLIDAATDAHLWAQTFDRELTTNNIFAIQSEIATAVTQAMRATLSPEEMTRMADVPTQNMAALEEYFKGRAELDQRTLPSIESARMRFEHARQLDPEFALALAGEAQAIIFLSDNPSSYGDIPEIETNALARALLERALQLTPNEPQVLAVFGLLEFAEENFTTALDYYKRSLALNPNSGEVMNWNQIALNRNGQFRASNEVAVRMIGIDPMSMITLSNGIRAMINSPYDDNDKIENLLQSLYQLDPGYGLSARAMVERRRGNLPAALALYYQVLETDPGRSSSRSDLAILLAQLGFGDEALQVSPNLAPLVHYFNTEWSQAAVAYQQRYEHDPSGFNTEMLMTTLVEADDFDAAFSLAQELWAKFATQPAQLSDAAITMAWVATKTEHPAEARTYLDVASRHVQNRIEAEDTNALRYRLEATLAAIDRRDDDAIKALSLGLEKGMRWHYGFQSSMFENLRDNPEFQALASRQRDLIEADRGAIKAMLCGPDKILTSWTPAPGTCL
jgi:TolB-like protein/tetratricopeptide (TPR) repeat protein